MVAKNSNRSIRVSIRQIDQRIDDGQVDSRIAVLDLRSEFFRDTECFGVTCA